MEARPQRLHALDGLRAAMMLLGLVLHAAASYTAVSLGAAWPYQDRSRGPVFNLLVFGIHLFRMPTFFVMAGFFAALLHQREGTRGFLVHRARRVLLPLAVAWPILCPLVLIGFAYAVGRAGGNAGSGAGALLRAIGDAGLIHLWFLYDLLLFCAVAAIVVPLLRRLPPAIDRGALALTGVIVERTWGLLIPVAVTAATLLPMQSAAIDTATSLLPPLRVLAAYGVFFAFGWLLHRRRELLPVFARPTLAWPCLAGAVLASAACLAAAVGGQSHLVGVVLAAAATWLWIFGLTGLFLRWFAAARPLQRYLADGAYWIYLVHLPCTIWLPGLLAPLAWPAPVKFALVLGGTAMITVGSYDLFVRSTWIGAALNGRRFPRGLPPP